MSNNSELINKLELLHKMKEEGKLSDEEYNLMKNKVMSALTGKVVETKPDTKKTEDEVLTDKSQTENLNNPLPQTEQKKSEESGILGKLEQLHKMKEEGKLSDEEYNFMKNKVMSALTGKVVETKPEPNKIEDKISTIKSKDETTSNPLSLSEKKQSEDTGILGKLEHLHKMKMEGILSDEEYNDMKNNIISAIPGSKTSSVSEIKKTEEEKVKPVVSNQISHKNYLSDVKAIKNISSDNDKIQISKKLIYGSVALLLLAAAFVFIYPKYSEEDDAGINKLVNYFSDEKQKETNRQVNDNLKNDASSSSKDSNAGSQQINKKENSLSSDNLNNWNENKIISEVTNGKFNKKEGTFNYNEGGLGPDEMDYSFQLLDLNNDGYPEVYQTNCCSQKYFGLSLGETFLYMKINGVWKTVNEWSQGTGSMKYLNSENKGFKDILFYGGFIGANQQPNVIWRWDGSKYELHKRLQSKNEENEYDNLDRVYSEKNNNEASDVVKSWIESLGKRDFETAYNLMSPSLSKSYAVFTSPNRYGGITKTKVHSVETVSSSGCNYVVVASYDSYDPYNRDGKFTERFNVNNCNGDWQITNIRNVNVEYYR
jgi:hypothetical protein